MLSNGECAVSGVGCAQTDIRIDSGIVRGKGSRNFGAEQGGAEIPTAGSSSQSWEDYFWLFSSPPLGYPRGLILPFSMVTVN